MAKSTKPAFASRNDLPDNAKQASIGVLQGILTDTIDLYNATRHAHWNVKGPQFGQLHALFEKFYLELAEDADDQAERIVALGGMAHGTTQTNQGTKLEPFPTNIVVGLELVTLLADRYAAAGKAMRAGIDETDEAGDVDTSDLLTGQSREMDKKLWMLEAHLQG